jgi:hypothetical protein
MRGKPYSGGFEKRIVAGGAMGSKRKCSLIEVYESTPTNLIDKPKNAVTC